MSTPHDCPIPSGQACPHSSTINVNQTQLAVILDRLNEVRDGMKALKNSVAQIATLEQGHAYHKEALSRAFDKITELEKVTEAHENEFSQFKGMKQLAIGLWSLLAGGLGVVILKVFSL